MTKKQTDKLMSVLLNITASLILIGAIFKLEHWVYGNEIVWIGLVSSLVIGSFEIKRLKKIIKSFESNMQKTD